MLSPQQWRPGGTRGGSQGEGPASTHSPGMLLLPEAATAAEIRKALGEMGRQERLHSKLGAGCEWLPFHFFRCVNGHNPPKPSCDTAPAPGQSRGSHPSFQKGNFPNLCNFPLPFFLLPLHQPKVSLNSKIPPGAAWGAETETNRARKWSSPN